MLITQMKRIALELSFIIENFGLSQHVKEPTHNKGHIFDLVISKGLNISNVMVLDVALLDHFCVLFDMTVILNARTMSKTFEKRVTTVA